MKPLAKSLFADQKRPCLNKFWRAVQILYVGLELDRNDQEIYFLPDEQLRWLQTQLEQESLPTLIFSHCPLDGHDTSGNFFYEAMDNRSKKALFLNNQEAALNIISSFPCVRAIFQAHLHYFNVKLINSVPYITCPAMGENICCPNAQDNIPEIYTIIAADEQRLSVKAFSGDYCFAGYEAD